MHYSIWIPTQVSHLASSSSLDRILRVPPAVSWNFNCQLICCRCSRNLFSGFVWVSRFHDLVRKFNFILLKSWRYPSLRHRRCRSLWCFYRPEIWLCSWETAIVGNHWGFLTRLILDSRRQIRMRSQRSRKWRSYSTGWIYESYTVIFQEAGILV